MRLVVAPDFPTGGLIVNSREELDSTYRTGIGSIRLGVSNDNKKRNSDKRATYQVSTSKSWNKLLPNGTRK